MKNESETYTPGPWRIRGDAGHPANIRITAAARRHVAKVYAENRGRDETCEANAHLIAAAPDMLTVLALLADEIRTCDDCKGTGKESPLDACRNCGGVGEVFGGGVGGYIGDVRAAIAKAEPQPVRDISAELTPLDEEYKFSKY